MMTEDVLKSVFDRYGLSMNFEQHALIGSTVRSYLSYLKKTGRIKAEIRENRWLWSVI